MTTFSEDDDEEWVSLAEAGSRLGYGRSRSYTLKNDLGAEKDPTTGRWRVRLSSLREFMRQPPARSRPRPVASATSVLELSLKLDELSSRVAQLEARESPATNSEGASGENWRRRAIAAEHALADLARVGDLYEDAWAATETAQSLEGEARDKRRDAARSLRTALAAHRAAIHMLTAPIDPSTLTD